MSIIAPAVTTPGAALTYAVNLRNFGPSRAEDVRAEFVLPDGFTLVGTTGWQSCETTLSTVVCSATALADDEHRAFLIAVLAPLRVGTYEVSARAGTSTPEQDFAGNEAIATTVIAP